MEKWVTLVKMGHTWKKESQLEKWVALGRVGHSCKNGSTWKNRSHLNRRDARGFYCKYRREMVGNFLSIPTYSR